jgi:hypothetical protein
MSVMAIWREMPLPMMMFLFLLPTSSMPLTTSPMFLLLLRTLYAHHRGLQLPLLSDPPGNNTTSRTIILHNYPESLAT